MDVTAVLGIVEKGLTVLEALYTAEQQAAPAIKVVMERLIALVQGAQTNSVTDEDLAQTEALLDKLVDDFNLSMEA